MKLVSASASAAVAVAMAICSSDVRANTYVQQTEIQDDQIPQVNTVAISGNLAVIGTPFAGADGGAAIYVRQTTACTPPNCSWSLAQNISPSDSTGIPGGANFGSSVAISGSSIVVGAPRAGSGTINPGAVYVFSKSGSSWSQTAKLVASDAADNDAFGYSVAATSTNIVAGAPGATIGTNVAQGAAYIFRVSGLGQVQKLVSPTGVANDGLGWSIAVSSDTVLVGAPYALAGATNTGVVEVFTKCVLVCTGGDPWPHSQQLNISTARIGNVFGWSVAIDGTNAVVGEPDQGPTSPGKAHVYARTSGTWAQTQVLLSSNSANDDLFGYAVGISGSLIAVSGLAGGPLGEGGAYTFVNSGGTWSSEASFDDGATYWDQYGSGIAISGGSFIVTAPSAGPSRIGEVFFYTRSP